MFQLLNKWNKIESKTQKWRLNWIKKTYMEIILK